MKIKANGQIARQGVLFDTELNNYFYDSGTGKVLQLDQVSYALLQNLFDLTQNSETFIDLIKQCHENDVNNFFEMVNAECLLQCPDLIRLYTYNHFENLENYVNSQLGQIILEVTEQCNLRCKYCIYNDNYLGNRNFGRRKMDWNIAKASVDYANVHSHDKIAITFYGGEPLLNFDLIKKTVKYAKQIILNKELTFSLTTNLTLITNEMAEFFASVDKLSIVCSLDGPKYIQNENRKYINQSGSFDDAINGLKILSKAFEKNKNNSISINAVFAPPYSYEKINDINEFFANLDFLPLDTNIDIGYASYGSIDDKESVNSLYNNTKYIYNREAIVNPLWVWQRKQVEKNGINNKKNNIYSSAIEKALIHINNRIIFSKPTNIFPFNGCCIPGARRLYIATNGNLHLCERIGTSPIIGNILSGINFNSLKKYYINDFSEKSTPFCSKCWASKMCTSCYVDNYNQNGCDFTDKNIKCEGIRNMLKIYLSLYHEFLENSPEKLEFLKDVQVI